MSVENNPRVTEKAGLLNKAVELVTLGRYGVDKIVVYGLKNNITGDIFQGHPIDHLRRTGKMVVVEDMSKNRHAKRKLVKRKP